MNKSIFIGILLILSLNTLQAQSYHLSFDIPDLPNQLLRLGHHSGPDIFLVDSAQTDAQGKAIMLGEKPLEHGIYFIVMPSGAHFDFLIGNKQQLSISTRQYKVLDSLKISGDIQNQAFVNFQQRMADFSKASKQLEIEKRFYQNTHDSIASINVKLKAIDMQRKALFDSLSMMFDSSVLGDVIQAMNPHPVPANIQALRNEKPDKWFNYISRHFFDHVNFSEPAVFNAPAHVFHNQFKKYCQYFLNARADSIHLVYEEIDLLLNKASASKTAHRYVLSYLMDIYENPAVVGMDAVFVYIARNYFEAGKIPWANAQIVQEIKRRADLLEQNLVGKTSVDLSFPDAVGEMHSLHEGKARYTLLWFFETDCLICTEKTKELVKIADDFKVMNVDVISVNIDQKSQAWKNYIEKYQLPFLNLWNRNENPDLLTAYGVYKTPRLYILNPEKTIVAKDIQPKQLLDYIEYLDENSPRLRNRFLFNSPVMH
ncbi:MAG: redoxin domain-containing protein [Bacteroidota bacterium]|nr:redoxin domain-containing protein [Bacteroidota bacterium]